MARFVTLYQSSIEYFAVANVLVAADISGWERYVRDRRVERRDAALRRTNGQNQITERGLFASHP